jgi:Protein of unknown function (DUF3105)
MAKDRVTHGRQAPAPRAHRTGPAGRTPRHDTVPWGAIAFYGIITLIVVGVIAYIAVVVLPGRGADDGGGGGIAGVREFGGLRQDHTTEAVRYPQHPPVGGPHDPLWQNCGVYTSPIRDENGVHSLEHGAVWITYRPDLPEDQIAALRARAEAGDYILMSPYPGLERPIALSAWGRQLTVDTAGDARIDRFLRTYVRGPQTPEPGAPCTGGKSTP